MTKEDIKSQKGAWIVGSAWYETIKNRDIDSYPIGSMYMDVYGIYANIGGIWMVNVTIYI